MVSREVAPPLQAEELLRRLSAGGVDFVVIGGIAVILQGSARAYTKDLDICYSREKENLHALGELLVELEAQLRVEGVDASKLPFVPDERTLANVEVLTLSTPLGWIDVLAVPKGAPKYGVLKRRAEMLRMDTFAVPVAGIEDMIAMKRAAGRPQDLADAEELEAILRVRRGDKPRDSFGNLPEDIVEQLRQLRQTPD